METKHDDTVDVFLRIVWHLTIKKVLIKLIRAFPFEGCAFVLTHYHKRPNEDSKTEDKG